MTIRLSNDAVPLAPLAARVEEVCLNAWPALQEIHYDGWLIRLADGQTRRTNSVNMVGNGARPLAEKIAYCESVYRRHGLPSCFRLLSSSSDELELELSARGYQPEGETSTLYMSFAEHPPPLASYDVEFAHGAPSAEWMAARMRFLDLRPDERAKIEKILQQLALPAVFAAVRINGSITSIAKGAVHDGIVCLNMVASDPQSLRRGYSHACLSAILNWARQEHGAVGACLQVVSANTPAIRLYERLGFAHELYRYHYRRLS
ncbi:MAG: GNAT family N-acetyltransferase [Alphaproteobacteria bacterium]|nr:GNAT family N-acetyltransferase [Alphaproteobacteria bacterium]